MDAHTYPRCTGHRLVAITLAVLSTLIVALPVQAADELETTEFLADLSLEELLSTKITTLSRKAEALGDAPAAVFVISQSDIRRSGARTIPDLLRMVPGMQVAQLDGNKWAVTSRGANGRFANKLLVLMDGRTLYSPLQGGVYWDVQDTDLNAIERIEVIRGPGATMWGSNAVNGVVNIITKHAGDTQGGNLSVAGSPGGAESVLRYGGQSEALAYRVYAKAFDRDGNVNTLGEDIGDDSNMARLGGRLDVDRADGHEWTVSAEVYDGESGEYRVSRSLNPPYEVVGDAATEVSGFFTLGRWLRTFDSGSELEIRSYYSIHDRDGATYTEEQTTFDFDLQHRIGLSEKSDLMWGVNYRKNEDATAGTFEITLDPANRSQELISTFVQGDFSIFDDRARLMIGSKFEKNNFSQRSVEVEPSARLSVPINQHNMVWASVSHASRMPSRGEQNGTVVTAILPPGQPGMPLPVPTVVAVSANEALRSEDVLAYEFGYRMRRDNLLIDVALFFNEFDNLRSIQTGIPTCQPNGGIPALDPTCLATATYVEAPLELQNESESETLGAELFISRPVAEWWRLNFAYTYFHHTDTSPTGGATLGITEDSPDHQVSVRSAMDLPRDLSLDLWLRWVDELESQQIDSYTALDIRMAWAVSPTLSLAAVGRNLFADEHLEFMSELVDLAPVYIEPAGYLEVRWSF